MKPSDFKIGDRVRVNSDKVIPAIHHNGKSFSGQAGEVTANTSTYVYVTLDSGQKYAFFPEELLHIGTWTSPFIKRPPSALSPQSPQTQTTQQKEDTVKPYAVIYHPLTTQAQASINGYYTTEAEAKEAAEMLVAGQRSNLTTKAFFAVTIVNTKTGKLIGSVVDAPPAVEWATS